MLCLIPVRYDGMFSFSSFLKFSSAFLFSLSFTVIRIRTGPTCSSEKKSRKFFFCFFEQFEKKERNETCSPEERERKEKCNSILFVTKSKKKARNEIAFAQQTNLWVFGVHAKKIKNEQERCIFMAKGVVFLVVFSTGRTRLGHFCLFCCSCFGLVSVLFLPLFLFLSPSPSLSFGLRRCYLDSDDSQKVGGGGRKKNLWEGQKDRALYQLAWPNAANNKCW